jgi:fructose-bisphosphate aldolase class II
MTAATLTDVLSTAEQGRHAVAGLVVLGWEDAVAFVEAAEETGIPIILQAGPGARKHTPISVLGKMFRVLAERASVPVVCHVDHARTFEECAEGIGSGFSSVMIDGSMLELSANIDLTARVAEAAHAAGISVEGEVGQVGYMDGKASVSTSATEAEIFAGQSGVDALAVSVGNLHLDTGKSAVIDFDALRAIEAVTSLPLVLHGGSGIPSDVRRKLAVEHRVRKFNIGTELRMAFGKALRQSLADQPREFDRIRLLQPTIAPLKQITAQVLRELRYPAQGAP